MVYILSNEDIRSLDHCSADCLYGTGAFGVETVQPPLSARDYRIGSCSSIDLRRIVRNVAKWCEVDHYGLRNRSFR